MKLEPHERDGATWKKVSAYVQKLIDADARALETDKSETDTAKLRGRIRALRLVLAMAAPGEDAGIAAE